MLLMLLTVGMMSTVCSIIATTVSAVAIALMMMFTVTRVIISVETGGEFITVQVMVILDDDGRRSHIDTLTAQRIDITVLIILVVNIVVIVTAVKSSVWLLIFKTAFSGA